LTVVVPTYNRAAILRRCLERLQAQDLPAECFEVIVVDDASSPAVEPELGPVFRNSPVAIRWLRVEENNLSRARNLAIEHASRELTLFIGDDILPTPQLLRTHLAFHSDEPDNVALLCRIDPDPEGQQTAFERFFNPFGFDTLKGDQEADCRYFWTNNISLKTEFLRRHGRFDEDFADANHEDMELGYRLERAGLRILYRDRLVGYHYHRYTLESACRAQYRRGFTYPTLRAKVPDEVFREWLGIFSWRNSARGVLRGVVRSVLFNQRTVPHWQRWLARDHDGAVRRFFYWKLLTYYTNKGYRDGRAAAGRRSG
jgi:GT2 family glycosyltransferase